MQVTAHDYSDNVNQLIAYIEEYKHFDQIISINVGNAIKFINQDSLVAIEVYGDELRFFLEKQLTRPGADFIKLWKNLIADSFR